MNALDLVRQQAQTREARIRQAHRNADRGNWTILAIAALLFAAWLMGVFAS